MSFFHHCDCIAEKIENSRNDHEKNKKTKEPCLATKVNLSYFRKKSIILQKIKECVHLSLSLPPSYGRHKRMVPNPYNFSQQCMLVCPIRIILSVNRFLGQVCNQFLLKACFNHLESSVSTAQQPAEPAMLSQLCTILM